MPSQQWLVLGQVGYGFKGLERRSTGPAAALRLADPPAPSGSAVAWIRYQDVVADRIQTWQAADGEVDDSGPVARRMVWTGLGFDVRPEAAREVASPAGLAPTFLVVDEPSAGRSVHRSVYCCSRVRSAGLVFSRIWSGQAQARDSLASAVTHASNHSPDLLYRLSDESRQATNLLKGTEIELKFSLAGDVSPWTIGSRFATLVQNGELEGFVPDVGNELQRWTYEQNTFAIERDGRSLGYVAFMLTHTGEYNVKYKLYEEDGLRRSETFEPNVSIKPSDFADYLTPKFSGCTITLLPQMTRSRFDVNVLSVRTGHFFGLETDEVHAGGQVLRQLELEYHKSQAATEVDIATIEPELFRLRDLAAAKLDDWGVPFELGYYSKLSFLKRVLDATPVG